MAKACLGLAGMRRTQYLPFTYVAYTTYMPASYTHHLVAKKTLALLPKSVRKAIQPHLPLYFFGAQGADFCFFYPVLGGFSQNLGSYLHRKGGFPAFKVCKTLSVQAPIFAYSLGYITHYATDVVFHPFIYQKTGKSPLRHTRLENALDKYFKSTVENNQVEQETDAYFRAKLTAKDKETLFFLYTAICARIGFPPLEKKPFFRAISLFNAYLLPSSKLFSIKSVKLVRSVATQADSLYKKALQQSETLCNVFLESIKKKTPLSCEIFGKSYLTGQFPSV